MKDLDFNELDRAVNSLIARTPGGSGSDVGVNNSSPVSMPVSSVQSISSSLPTIPVVSALPAIERPTTGRFMDVVHPSSNMRAPLTVAERAPASVPVPPARQTVVQNTTQPNTWPDPLSFGDNNPTNTPVNKDEDADIDRISNDIANTFGQTPSDSLESPFLSGAKVEKRPLGAFSNQSESSSMPQPTLSMPSTAPIILNTPPSSAEIPQLNTDTPLPAELQNDLLSIESDTAQPEKPVVTPTPAIPVMNPQPVPPVSVPAKPIIQPSTSIQPQYQEQPSTGDQNSGAIYDTKAYHKAMVRPAKKKSGWMWVVWIVLILVVSAGIGAAIYFFVLPQLKL